MPAPALLPAPTEPTAGVTEEPTGAADPSGPVPAAVAHAETPAEAVFRQALKLMDDLSGVRAAIELLAQHGQGPGAAAPAPRPTSDPASPDSSPVPSADLDPAPYSGGAPSGAAGGAASSGGSAALYALVVALAALAAGLWSRLQLVPIHWRSVALVALNERPG
jgi:hypothetical protein